jgi:hypothetical protein
MRTKANKTERENQQMETDQLPFSVSATEEIILCQSPYSLLSRCTRLTALQTAESIAMYYGPRIKLFLSTQISSNRYVQCRVLRLPLLGLYEVTLAFGHRKTLLALELKTAV